MVSIVVSCYNQAKYLRYSLDSIIHQSYIDWECLIINDGSSDNTDELAKSYCIIDKRIKYIKQENQGVCIARNNGVVNSSGKYILFLDADDIIDNSLLEKFVNVLETKPNVKIVASNVKYFGNKRGVLRFPDYNMTTLLGRNIFVVTSRFRKEDGGKVGGFNVNMKDGLEDWDFWISILEKGGDVYRFNEPYFHYRIRSKSRNNSISENTLHELRKTIWENHKELFSKVFFDPKESFEFHLVKHSKKYKLGELFLSPLKFVRNYLKSILLFSNV
jgi:glycosyltransferase involved in cell wall biosynthesis